MRGPLEQDDALERIVIYFDDVHAELMDHSKAIDLMQKAIAGLVAATAGRTGRR